MELALLLGLPLAGAAVLGFAGERRRAADISAAFSLGTFLAACALTARVIRRGDLVLWREQFFLDPLNVFLVILTAFVAFTTALFSRTYLRVEMEHGRVTARRLRLYHAMYQLFCLAMLVALTANNLGLVWVAMEGATLSTVLLVTLYRAPASLEAGWKYFILCGVGIAQALFGTILLYFAAERVLGPEGVTALLWTHLYAVRSQLEPAVLALAFVFLIVGYGTKAGLAPLNNWLPDAHAEGPTPISAVLSGLLLNVALYAIVRCKVLAEGALHSALPSRILLGFGLASVSLASLFLLRQRDVKRLFAYSSIEHTGLAAFAFGLGGPVATFAALLHMTVHSLTKSSIFYTVGHVAQRTGSQLMDDIRGLAATAPALGWALMLGSLAILGLPPFGLFTSEFLILATAVRLQPWTAPILLAALGIAFAAIFHRVQGMVFGEPGLPRAERAPGLLPVFAHLAIVLLLGLYIPPHLAGWYRAAARLVGGP